MHFMNQQPVDHAEEIHVGKPNMMEARIQKLDVSEIYDFFTRISRHTTVFESAQVLVNIHNSTTM